jgi:glutamine synthetase
MDGAPPPSIPALPPGTRAVRLVWTDAAGLRRARVVPALTWPDAAVSGVALAEVCLGLQTLADVAAWPPPDEAGPPGPGLLVPGVGAVARPLGPSSPGHASIPADIVDPVTRQPLPTCPRSALARAAAALQAEGLAVRVGVEVEFRLVGRERHSTAACPAAAGPPSYALDSTLNRAAPILDAIVDSLTASGIPVLHYHGESGTGAFEMVLAPSSDLVEAADGLVHARSVIASAACAAGYDATFAPKPVPGEAGLGAHVHMSVWRVGRGGGGRGSGRNLTAAAAAANDGRLGPASSTGRAFMAGILSRLPGLVALTAGSPSSFARAVPGCWAGAHARWGVEDKEAALRYVPGGRSPDAGRFEVKALDGSANPYIALAALVASGLAGVEECADLGPPKPEGAAPRLPASVGAALEALAAPAVAYALRPIIPARLLALVAAVRRADEAAHAEAGEEAAREGYVRVYS